MQKRDIIQVKGSTVPSLMAGPENGRALLSKELFERLVTRIVKDEHVDQEYAERIMDQALAFLKVCADNPGLSLRPSKAVDIGWHTFILHTREYADFCDSIAGGFLHHVPDEFDPSGNPSDTLAPTLNAMRLAGLALDKDLWAHGTGDCSQCHGGCTDCGQGGPGH